MSDVNDPFADSLARILADHPAGGAPASDWPTRLWDELADAGFPQAMVAESQGGAGLAWSDAFELLAQIGVSATPAPLAECLVARWLAAAAGLEPGPGFVSLAAGPQAAIVSRSADGASAVTGDWTHVPWGRRSDAVVAIADSDGQPQVVILDPRSGGCHVEHGFNLAGEPRDRLRLDHVPVRAVAPAPGSAVDLHAIAATVRAAQIAGALRAVLAMTLEYAQLRVQFGRALSAFQVIQQNLAMLASQTAAALAAAQGGLDALSAVLDRPGRRHGAVADCIAVASAKIRCGEAAGQGAALAHQVFGAIGFTEEHPLHLHTRRLWSWREEFGNEAWWSARLGHAIIAAGPEALWPAITTPSAATGAAA